MVVIIRNTRSNFQTKRLPNDPADVPTPIDRFLCLGLGSRSARIAKVHRKVSQEDYVLTQYTPGRLHWRSQRQQFLQIVSLAERYARLLESSLQVFLRALLSVKAGSIVVRVLASAEQRPGGIPISFRFADPFPDDRLRKGLSHVPGFRG